MSYLQLHSLRSEFPSIEKAISTGEALIPTQRLLLLLPPPPPPPSSSSSLPPPHPSPRLPSPPHKMSIPNWYTYNISPT